MIETSKTNKHVILEYFAFFTRFLRLDVFRRKRMNSKNLARQPVRQSRFEVWKYLNIPCSMLASLRRRRQKYPATNCSFRAASVQRFSLVLFHYRQDILLKDHVTKRSWWFPYWLSKIQNARHWHLQEMDPARTRRHQNVPFLSLWKVILFLHARGLHTHCIVFLLVAFRYSPTDHPGELYIVVLEYAQANIRIRRDGVCTKKALQRWQHRSRRVSRWGADTRYLYPGLQNAPRLCYKDHLRSFHSSWANHGRSHAEKSPGKRPATVVVLRLGEFCRPSWQRSSDRRIYGKRGEEKKGSVTDCTEFKETCCAFCLDWVWILHEQRAPKKTMDWIDRKTDVKSSASGSISK